MLSGGRKIDLKTLKLRRFDKFSFSRSFFDRILKFRFEGSVRDVRIVYLGFHYYGAQ